MRLLLVLPAISITLALAAVLAGARQIADATRALAQEIERFGHLSRDLGSLRTELTDLRARRAKATTARR